MAEIFVPFAASNPDAPALIDELGTTTWRELNERANRIIHAVRAAGVGQGGVVAAMLPNRREYIELFVAAAHGGFLVVPINWHWVADEVAYVLADADVRVLVADERFADVARAAAATRPELTARLSVGGAIEGFTAWDELVASGSADEPDEQALGGPMFYTSGTTGRPKGVRGALSTPGMPASLLQLLAAGFSQSMGLPADPVSYLNGPVYHSAQWAFSVLPLLGGSTVVMTDRFDPAEALRVIDRHGVTNTHLVPTQFVRLLKLPDDVKAAFDGSSLQVVWHGAAPCPPEVKRRMIEWWGPKITEYYGATEASIVSLATSEQWLAKPGTVGPVLPTNDVLIVGDDGNELGPNESGTIYVRNKMGMDFEYHGDDEKTAKAHLQPGVFTIGDIGYLDDDGWLFLSDRKIDMIISGGVNIYPAEIEGVLVSHPAVRDAAVFGVPNDEFGEEVKAAVELSDGETATAAMLDDITSFCRARLASYKVPRSIDVVDALPRHPTGKLYKRLLRDPYWEGMDRSI
jgi:long-chain acyl-CoA synthetase